MVTIQVDHINLLFAEIQRVRENNWEEVRSIYLSVLKNYDFLLE